MTTLIQNDAVVAGERATALASGASALSASGDVMEDSQTTVFGNQHALEAISRSKQTAWEMVTVLTTMSANLHSVSSHFQAMDTELKSQIDGLELSRRFNLP